MVELYYNSNQFRHTLAFLVKQFRTPFEMFEKLAELLLLEFAQEWCQASGDSASVTAGGAAAEGETVGSSKPEYAEILRELLTYDTGAQQK